MTRRYLSVALVMLAAVLFLGGCFGPKTPQEVAKAFWQAVLDNDAQDVVRYSTLDQPQNFDSFTLDWQGYTPSWGRVVIDGDKASIVTDFLRVSKSTAAKRQCVTYLVRRDDVWQVDYQKTGNDLRGGELGVLLGQLHQLSDAVSRSIDASVTELNAEMERLGRQLQALSDSLSQQTAKIMDNYADELQHIMQQLEDSIRRALQDQHNHPSQQDRRTLTEVAAELDASRQQLARPTTQSVNASNRHMVTAQQRLDAINSGITPDYKAQWQAYGRQFATAMHKLADELASKNSR